MNVSSIPSCTKTVIIRTEDGDVIKLKQDREIAVNGEEVILESSVWIHRVVIRHASSVFLAGGISHLIHPTRKFLNYIFFVLHSGTPQRPRSLVGRSKQVGCLCN
jgi:hypothetical protein